MVGLLYSLYVSSLMALLNHEIALLLVILIVRVYALCGPSRRSAIFFTLFGAVSIFNVVAYT
jgi:hypothetical protein